MKRVLGIVGSPRKNGNTHILVSRILEGAQAEGAIAETLLLGDLTIRECDGCHACWKGKSCSKQDDMKGIYAKIVESDVIVFGTPVYWYGPTALMKALIDRFVYFNCPENRAKIRNKSAIIAVPLEDNNPHTADLVAAFFEKSLEYLEMKLVGQVIAPGVGEKGDILREQEKLNEGYELGRTVVRVNA
jgi:multimeric flavodoxin WrbA